MSSPAILSKNGQPLVTSSTILGQEHNTITTPFNAVVIGMTSLPAVSPGEPICNLVKLPKGYKPSELRKLRSEEDGPEQRVSDELASNVHVVEPPWESGNTE
ncbi:hypothetical protein ACFLZ5_10880 [Thermodesulfobacteriota bacterium]